MLELLAPAGPAAFWWVVFAMSLAALAGVVAFAVWYWRREPTPQVKVAPVARPDRERWVARIDDVVARHPVGTPEQVRALHLALAVELRAILGERTGMDVSSWQVSQLREVAGCGEAAAAIGSWEEPSFSAHPQASAQAARDRAVKAVLAW